VFQLVRFEKRIAFVVPRLLVAPRLLSERPARSNVQNKNSRPFNHTRAATGDGLELRAVVFDYGMVLTGPPDPAAFNAMLRITGLPQARFQALYWAGRPAYDEGKVPGLEFWQNLVRTAGLRLSPAALDELNDWDARMWTVENRPMLAWQQQVSRRGLRTAILSNIGDYVYARIVEKFDWIARFDVQVWSYKLGVAKPAPAIYRYALQELGTAPEETLYLDDLTANIDAARALGIKGQLFTNAAKLRQDLVAQGLDSELPLPE
jgi:putative hydrolase of the HAD superfamily